MIVRTTPKQRKLFWPCIKAVRHTSRSASASVCLHSASATGAAANVTEGLAKRPIIVKQLAFSVALTPRYDSLSYICVWSTLVRTPTGFERNCSSACRFVACGYPAKPASVATCIAGPASTVVTSSTSSGCGSISQWQCRRDGSLISSWAARYRTERWLTCIAPVILLVRCA